MSGVERGRTASVLPEKSWIAQDVLGDVSFPGLLIMF